MSLSLPRSLPPFLGMCLNKRIMLALVNDISFFIFNLWLCQNARTSFIVLFRRWCSFLLYGVSFGYALLFRDLCIYVRGWCHIYCQHVRVFHSLPDYDTDTGHLFFFCFHQTPHITYEYKYHFCWVFVIAYICAIYCMIHWIGNSNCCGSLTWCHQSND